MQSYDELDMEGLAARRDREGVVKEFSGEEITRRYEGEELDAARAALPEERFSRLAKKHDALKQAVKGLSSQVSSVHAAVVAGTVHLTLTAEFDVDRAQKLARHKLGVL